MLKKYKDLGTMLSKDEMKEVKGGRISLPAFGCVVFCCDVAGLPPALCITQGIHSSPVAIETCDDIPWGCSVTKPCTCLVAS